MLSLLHHASNIYHSILHIRDTYAEAHDEMTSVPFSQSPMPTATFDAATETVENLQLKLPEHLSRPRVAIVCGSGLGGLAETVNRNERVEFEYKDVPNFPLSTVPGHEGKLIFSTMGASQVPVVLLVGRAHFYEGHSLQAVTFATRVCKILGVEIMILTNAAGGLNPTYKPGDIVLLHDHINLAGLVGFHPLRGPNDTDFGTRFPPLSDAYDLPLRQLAVKAWRDLHPLDFPTSRSLHEGIYAFAAGPSYETRAECRMLRSLGADVVGMSTVPEIIVARHSGMRVLAISLVTNAAVLDPSVKADDPELEGLSRDEIEAVLGRGKANHEEVLEEGRVAATDVQGLVLRVVEGL